MKEFEREKRRNGKESRQFFLNFLERKHAREREREREEVGIDSSNHC